MFLPEYLRTLVHQEIAKIFGYMDASIFAEAVNQRQSSQTTATQFDFFDGCSVCSTDGDGVRWIYDGAASDDSSKVSWCFVTMVTGEAPRVHSCSGEIAKSKLLPYALRGVHAAAQLGTVEDGAKYLSGTEQDCFGGDTNNAWPALQTARIDSGDKGAIVESLAGLLSAVSDENTTEYDELTSVLGYQLQQFRGLFYEGLGAVTAGNSNTAQLGLQMAMALDAHTAIPGHSFALLANVPAAWSSCIEPETMKAVAPWNFTEKFETTT